MRRLVLLLAAVGTILLVTSGVVLAATLRGTGGDDALNGTKGSDEIYGYGGNDFMGGYGGDDAMFGGSGHDGLDSTPSAPEGIKAPGHDFYSGGTGDDTIASWADGDRPVRDYVFCGRGNDKVYADQTDYVARDCERVRVIRY